MSLPQHRILAESALRDLLKRRKIAVPLSSSELLAKVVSYRAPVGLFPDNLSTTRFRLVDRRLFESVLEQLSVSWDDGSIQMTTNDGTCMITELSLGGGGTTRLTASALEQLNPRKRKRVIDEDADSATANQPEEEEFVDDHGDAQTMSLTAELKEVYNILQRHTAKGRLLAEQFRSPDESFEPICGRITKKACAEARLHNQTFPSASSSNSGICDRVHFRPLIRQHTDTTLGHCSYLNTCYSEPTYAQSPSIPPFTGAGHGHHAPPNTRGPSSLPSGLGSGGRGKEKQPCRYLHFELDWDGGDGEFSKKNGTVEKSLVGIKPFKIGLGTGPTGRLAPPRPPQWINCDLRHFDYSVLGKFHVIMADPPWYIHMSLPYGTMTDDEMRAMPIPALQDEGLLFLWVTGRAMEVGRECMRVWGYTRVDEVVWLKTNQLQRVIRTGRTGHWLNHTKEHMLVGIKTQLDANGQLKFPSWANRGLDADVIVSEVRETSRKPEEVYGMIERMCPGGRKVEIFGRKHNTRPGWLTLGNQLGVADQIAESDLAERILEKYPHRELNIVS